MCEKYFSADLLGSHAEAVRLLHLLAGLLGGVLGHNQSCKQGKLEDPLEHLANRNISCRLKDVFYLRLIFSDGLVQVFTEERKMSPCRYCWSKYSIARCLLT